MFHEFLDHFLEVASLFGFDEVQLLGLFLLDQSPLQNSVCVQVPVGTAVSVEKERIGRF